MNSQMGFSSKLRRLTAPVCVMIRGELAIAGASSCHRLHMRVGLSRLALIDVGRQSGQEAVLPHRRMFPRRVERCLTNRAPVASLVLRPSRSSFSVSLIKAY